MKCIKKLETRRNGNGEMKRWALFYCEHCNKEIEKRYHQGLKQNSCGCANKKNFKHGDNREGKLTRLYRTWVAVKNRCNNPNNRAYKYYGGRGIKVCDEWKEYIPFKTWALSHGYSDKLTIDRRKNNGNYEPNNCRWVTQAANNQNKRDTKLNWLTVRLIRALRDKGLKPKELFKIFDIKFGTLDHVIYNQSWVE